MLFWKYDFIREKHVLCYNGNAAFIRGMKCSYYVKNCGPLTEKRQNYHKENSEIITKNKRKILLIFNTIFKIEI